MVVGEAQQRAEDVLFSLYKPVTLTVGEAEQLARDVLALCDRVEAAEKERDETSDALQALAADHYFARAERAEKQVEALRKIIFDPTLGPAQVVLWTRAALSGTAEEEK